MKRSLPFLFYALLLSLACKGEGISTKIVLTNPGQTDALVARWVEDISAMMRRGLVRAVVCQQPVEQGYRAVREALEMILSGEMPQDKRVIMENQIKITENL